MDVKELDAMCIELIALEGEKKRRAEALQETNKAINALQFKLADIFQELDKEENSGDWGRVVIKRINEFKVENEEMVYSWLKDEGKFDSLAKIHAGTLKRVIKEEIKAARQAAKDAGNDDPEYLYWTPEGVEETEIVKVTAKEA